MYKLNHFVTQSSLQDALVKFEEGGENILVMVVNIKKFVDQLFTNENR